MTYTHSSGRASQSGGSVVLSLSSPPPQAASAASSSMPNSVRTMLALCVPAVAASIVPAGDAAAQESWRGSDKVLHLGGSAVMGAVAAELTESNPKAFAGCAAVGAAKELASLVLLKVKPSGKDMAVNLLGCGLGLAGGRLAVQQGAAGPVVTYRWEY